MRNIRLLYGLMLVFLLLACKREQIDLFNYPPYQTDRKVLGVMITATWNERSGELGLPLFYDQVNRHSDVMIPLVAHAATVGDPFYSLAASQFYSLYETEIFPGLGLNATGFPLEEIDLFEQALFNQAFTIVNGDTLPASPAVVLAAAKRVEDNRLKAKVRARVRQNINNAQLNMAVYVSENRVLGFQAGTGTNIFHEYVLRGGATAGPWGVNLKNGDFRPDEVFEQEVSFRIGEELDPNQLFIVAVIYRMENGYPVEVLNCYRI